MNKTNLTLPDIGGFDNVKVIEVHIAVGTTVVAEDSIITLESDKEHWIYRPLWSGLLSN